MYIVHTTLVYECYEVTNSDLRWLDLIKAMTHALCLISETVTSNL